MSALRRLIYTPSGRAGEYANKGYAANLFTGCTHGCIDGHILERSSQRGGQTIMIFIGLDPGKTGAIAVLLDDGTHVMHDMPLIKEGKKEHIDLSRLFDIIYRLQGSRVACLERQQAYPNQGSVSNFSTGYGYAALRMALIATGTAYEEVHPKTWQKHYGISKDTKGQSCAVAERLFRTAELRGPRGSAKDGRADALLLAEYIARKYRGKA